MSSWPPPPETVAAGVASVCGWLLLRLWNKAMGRIEALERDAVRREDQRDRDERLERSVGAMQASITEGFQETRAANEAVRAEVQRQAEAQAARTSSLIKDVHDKVERIESELRREIGRTRGE